jgi:extradiol dioxygenase family protein
VPVTGRVRREGVRELPDGGIPRMSVELNHTIVHARNARESAGSPGGSITTQHYAFLVSGDGFDAAFERIKQAGITYYADPFMQQPGRINSRDGERGLYFHDPDGHAMEIMTRS